MEMNSEAAEDNLQKLFSWMFINGKLIVCRKCEDQYLNIEENFVEVPGIRSGLYTWGQLFKASLA